MLYTRKGDQGTTKVFDSDKERISKASELPEALGALDELNAFLGFVKLHASVDESIVSAIRDVQENLFIIQAEVAGADKRIKEGSVAAVEELTNAIEVEIPPITNFSIAGGTELSALLDVSRTLARRAERRIVAVLDAKLRTLSPETLKYVNRLSSLLFALSRLANHLAGVPEENPRY